MSNIIRDNFVNRILHCGKLREQREEYRRRKCLVNAAPAFIQSLADCDSLMTVLSIHKDLWGSGFHNKNIGPDEYGMFRTKDILTMKPEEVFLGNIYGLWTHEIPFWEERKEDPVGANCFGMDENTSLYKIILNQYCRLLMFNVEEIRRQAEDYVCLYETVNP